MLIITLTFHHYFIFYWVVKSCLFQGQEGCDVTRRSWVGDVQDNNTTQSICGLEISFSSVPQDIDIKLIPGNSNCAVDNLGMPPS